MSERIVNDAERSSGGQPFRCAWMDHWMQPRYSELMEKRGSGIRIEELHSASVGSVNGLKVTEAGIVETVSDSLRSKSGGGEDSSSISRGTSMNPLAWMKTKTETKTRVPAKDEVFVEAKPLREMELSAHVVPNRFDFERCERKKGKAVVSVSNNELTSSSLGSADLTTRKRKMPSKSEPDYSLNAGFRDENSSFTFDAPTTSDHSLKQFGQEWFQKMQNGSFIGMFPNQCIDLEKTIATPHKFNDVETMRISTTVEGTRGGCPRFSQTTHSLLITKKTVTDTSNDLHSLPPFFGKANQGLKIQSLTSSNDSEAKTNVGDVKASKAINNESSAETDTLDLDINEKNLPLGTRSTSSIKALNMEQYLLPRGAVASSREVGHRRMNTELPDINLEPPPSLTTEDFLTETAGFSSSRTQSFEMDMFLGQSKPKLNLNLDDSNILDPSNRWVKRLKLRSSNNNTDSSNLAQNSSHGSMSKSFSTILKNSISSSNPNQILSDKVGDLHVDAIEKGEELTLSNAWIQRWMSNESRIATKKAEALGVCELQSSKMAMEDLEKKQFPSIGAMALMGKAMGGFQQCELRKRGAITVWNTKAF